MIELGNILQHKGGLQIPNFGFVILELTAAGKDPSKEPIPGILREIESLAESWIKEDLRDCILAYMGPQLLSPRADRLPEFRLADSNKKPLVFTKNIPLQDQDFVCKCKITMDQMPKDTVSEDFIAKVQKMIHELILSAIELAGATA